MKNNYEAKIQSMIKTRHKNKFDIEHYLNEKYLTQQIFNLDTIKTQ